MTPSEAILCSQIVIVAQAAERAVDIARDPRDVQDIEAILAATDSFLRRHEIYDPDRWPQKEGSR